MKKVYGYLLLCVSLMLIGLCTSCGQSGRDREVSQTSTIADNMAVMEEETPLWAKTSKKPEKFIMD